MKKIIIILLSILFADFKECGTEIDSLAYNVSLREYSDIRSSINRDEMPDVTWAPITFHIVRNDNGTGGLPPHRIDIGLQDMLSVYSEANIYPYKLGEIDYIDNSEFLSITSYEEMAELKQINIVENSINIYAVELLNNGDYDLCGISTFTWSSDQGIIMANSCFATSDNNSTLAHELGHYFNLYHTHQGSGSPNDNGVIQGANTEFVDGTECNTRGDGLCDTPADPTLSDLVDGSCEYFGSYLDGHGDLFEPDETNLMSYSQKNCRDFLSDEQNIKSVYTIQSERPEINYPPLEPYIVLLDSTIIEIEGDGDGVVNPNEVANINVSLKNWDNWPDANNVQIELSSDSPDLNVINSVHSCSVIGSGEVYSTINNPFKIETLDKIGLFNLKLTITSTLDDGAIYIKEYPLNIEVSLYQAGYPLIGINQVESSPIVSDLDGDLNIDMVFGDYDGNIHYLDYLGNQKDGFPINVGDDIWGAPASADLDLDGDIEIIVSSKNGFITILNQIGEIELSLDLDQFLMGTPAIGNFDLDDELEIAIASYSNSGQIYIINHNGSFVNGFPLHIGEKMLRGPSIYDIDNNGLDDIVVATESDNIYLIYDSGEIATGFPFMGSDKFKSSPTILDVNNDIIILSGNKEGKLYAIDRYGELLWQIDSGSNIATSCSLIDLNSKVGIFYGTDLGLLYGVDHNGEILSGFPINTGSAITVSPAFSDMNNDGEPEIILGNASGEIFAYSLDGVIHDFFPILGGYSVIGSPSINDIDLDGDLELVFGITAGIMAIDIKSEGSNNGYWNMYKGNNLRNGNLKVTLNSGCDNIILGDMNCDTVININDVVLLIEIILEEEYPQIFQEISGDLNSDNILDILDIISIINNILES